MVKSKNLGLSLNGSSEQDVKMTFSSWRKSINGEGSDSNMNIIDRAIGAIQTAVEGFKNHKHSFSEITDKPDAYPPEAHGHPWSDITDKPTTFAPATHDHSYKDLKDKPSIPDVPAWAMQADKPSYSADEISYGDNSNVGEALSSLKGANEAQDQRLTALEQAGGIVTVEPADGDVPLLFYSEALPQTKTGTAMPISYVSKTLKRDDADAETKAQGTSSLSYPKKNQTTKFSQAFSFKNWGSQKKYCMKANWIDLTHARNIVSAQLWGDVVKSRANYLDLPELLRTSPNQGAIDGFPALVYADGVYQGRYTINIPKDAWMANMDKTLDNHCILCGENYVSGCFRATANINGSDWSDEVHDTVPAAIKTRWNEIISFVMNSTNDEFVSGIGNYFYLDSLIDYYIFGVVTCGLDAFGKNQLYMTYDGQKWIASMYDMDSTWGLWWNGSSFVATDYARTEFQDFKDGEGNLLYIRLEELFYEQIQARWTELKDTVLSYSNIMTRFERFIGLVPPHIVKEDYASTTGGSKFTGIPSQNTNHIQQIRSYVAARLPYTDGWFASLTPAEEIPCTGIILDQTTLTFNGEGTQTLTATVTPSDTTDTVAWSSDDPSIASVSGGVVTAKANGSATITATCGDYSAVCNVTVEGIDQAAGLGWSDTAEYKINRTNGSVENGDSYVSDFVEVTPGQMYKLHNTTGTYNYLGAAWYDSDKEFLGYYEEGSGSGDAIYIGDYDLGVTRYVRLRAYPNNNASNNNPQEQLAFDEVDATWSNVSIYDMNVNTGEITLSTNTMYNGLLPLNPIEVEAGKTYTFTFTGSAYPKIAQYDSDMNFISASESVKDTVTSTMGTETRYVRPFGFKNLNVDDGTTDPDSRCTFVKV